MPFSLPNFLQLIQYLGFNFPFQRWTVMDFPSLTKGKYSSFPSVIFLNKYASSIKCLWNKLFPNPMPLLLAFHKSGNASIHNSLPTLLSINSQLESRLTISNSFHVYTVWNLIHVIR